MWWNRVGLGVWLCLFVCASSGALRVRAQSRWEVVFSSPQGNHVTGVTTAEDGSVYATLSAGGERNSGTLIRRAADGVVSVLHTFEGPEGMQPLAAMAWGADGELYGTTPKGGAHGYGTAFRLTRAGDYSVLHHFTVADGGSSTAALTLASDGELLGVTSGIYEIPCSRFEGCWLRLTSYGQIFKLAADGTFRVLYDRLFGAAGPITEASTGDLYGAKAMLSWANDLSDEQQQGAVYRLSTDGTMSFGGSLLGMFFDPRGALSELDGYLYGVSEDSVFRMTLGPEGAESEFHVLANADFSSTGLALGSDGKLYGGSDVFQSLSFSGVVTELRDYAFGWPSAPIRAHGANGFVVGSGDYLSHIRQSGEVSLLHHFGFQNQQDRYTLLITRSGLLYGTTTSGGPEDRGALFQVDQDGRLSILQHFTSSVRALREPLVEAADGALYGVTEADVPALVRVDHALSEGSGSSLTSLYVFEGSVTGVPESLVVGTDGGLYGTVHRPGGDAGQSTFELYRFDVERAELRVLGAFPGSSGPLLAAASGAIYGISRDQRDQYALYRITPSGERTILHAFAVDAHGHVPISNLAQAPDGTIYGLARGNADAWTIVYRWTTAQRLELHKNYTQYNNYYYSPRQLTVGANGEVYVTLLPGQWNGLTPRTTVILPNGDLQQLREPSLGLVTDAERGIYRIAPLRRNGAVGFQVLPLVLP